ncbi:MAG: NAD(P)H-dependent oxidoreductase [Alphaproteobacteria bacterium]|uniref:NAD(P)H-dependent oxidoreductase n=1 Tax=Candidatus Nitrobium versatile TaxID=2884831 RepID=A0A953J486_9BACT|nr:NAD(P)H-dependent oxidoreductase [Candidatus Nitrobium versatile]
MKIAVLNGSPKGDMSVTMQYVHFIRKNFPQHEFRILNIAQQIKGIEKEDSSFRTIIDAIREADGVLWAFPLYIFLVSSQYKRFIELITERKAEEAFRGKYTAVLTTSIHFFDHTAHAYMHGICDDLGMKYAGSFSADMYDLIKEEMRGKLKVFAEYFFEAIECRLPAPRSYPPVVGNRYEYIPGPTAPAIDAGDKRVVLLTDSSDTETNLGRMIERIRSSFSREIEVLDLNALDIKGGCMGCVQCGYDNACAYGDQDAFMEFYNSRVKTADILLYAGTIKDRYLSSRWKTYFDRSFFNTHIPTLAGKQIGVLISGPLGQLPHLRQILEAHTEWQQANLVDFVTDESGDSAVIDSLLDSLARRLVRFASSGYVKPPTFLGVAGMKIFRDDIWGRFRFPFQADHTFFKKHGAYDFPQKNYSARITNALLLLLTRIPPVRKEIYKKKMKEEMIKPLKKAVEK